MKLLQVFQASYACILCLLHLQVAMEVSGSEVVSPPVAQSTLVRHDKKLPSSSLLGPDQLRELQAVASTTWVQVGNDIDGEASGDSSGSSVAVSEDGTRVAIGATWNDNENGSDSGHVRVYDYKSSSESWVQVGQDIDGEVSGDKSGHSIAMSDDGSRVAISTIGIVVDQYYYSGNVRVYDYDSSSESWVQVGNAIAGTETYYVSKVSLAMSDDGSRFAIGDYGSNNNFGIGAGHVRVYAYGSSSESWVQVGNDINGEYYGCYERFGLSVAMSDDGSRVAIGSNNGSFDGRVTVCDYDSSTESWVQVGNDIDGEDYGDSVAISDDGSRVAIGARYNDNENGSNSGHVRVYDYDSSSESWVQVGNDINGEDSEDRSGGSVAMSDDGSRVAIGARYNDNENGSNSGHVRVYDYDSSSESWVQVGDDIDGEDSDDRSGGSVAMSGNGSRVAIGASGNDNSNGGGSGHVRVYTATPDAPTVSPAPSMSSAPSNAPSVSSAPSSTCDPFGRFKCDGEEVCFWYSGACRDCYLISDNGYGETVCVNQGCTWNGDSCE